MSPIFLILVSLVFTSALLSVIFYLAWRNQGQQAHALSWSMTFALATVQWIFNLLIDQFPSHETYWISVNILALLAITFAVQGHCLRVGRTIRQELLWGAPAAALFIITWFTVIQPHIGLRMAIGPAYAAFALAFCARCILRFSEKISSAELGSAITLIVFAVSQFVAAGAAVMQGPVVDQSYLDVYLIVNFTVMPAAFTGMGMFVVFMLASDLSIELKEQAVRDQLTGLLNRRGFGEAGASAYAIARRTDRPVSVIMTDIDRFKLINDEYGHTIGDEALAHFAVVLAQGRRTEDILARIGGEEFALVLPGTQLQETIHIAEDLCQRLEETSLETSKGKLQMTASFGVATISVRDTCLSDTIIRADTALYRSKKAGRNRVDLESSQKLHNQAGALNPVGA
jgi:diguanylate cyclase (GGDEF)-like protein